ncbi:MAG TPA: hypothetical protein VM450_02760 [Thermomicrobiales bacterium]|nr:hypothetical protein [Thermomicrobiales bacterium]
MTLYLGMQREILIVDQARPQNAERRLDGKQIAAIETDPHRPGRVYCGTFDRGLWRSDDHGDTWTRRDAFPATHVQSVAVSPVDKNLVFAGTEPSELYRSDDGGDTWRELSAMRELPSAPTWSFPPKPETSHVRWIAPHTNDPARMLVAIEAGALVQTHDGGETWQDRRPGGPYDSHTVRIHPDAPERVLSAAGDGFFESTDGGQTWERPMDGLPWGYCWGLAVDASDPETVLMSVAPGAGRGHGRRDQAQSVLCRRRVGGSWEILRAGLPDDHGTNLSSLVADPTISGTFYALTNTGLYHTTDHGDAWERLDVPWPEAYLEGRPPALAISRLAS